jgi:hypothetical protein
VSSSSPDTSWTAPDPTRILVVTLGASAWPRVEKNYVSHVAFANSARRLRKYFLSDKGLRVSRENVLDLFDSPLSSINQVDQISDFVERRLRSLGSMDSSGVLVFVTYVGHGAFFHGDEYCLLLSDTHDPDRESTSLRLATLARVLSSAAPKSSRFIILDSCFAGAAVQYFQSNLVQVERVSIDKALVGPARRGVALLCAASAHAPARLSSDKSETMFTRALVDVLEQGHPSAADLLTPAEVCQYARERLQGVKDAPRPEAHAPDQRESDLTQVRVFPNPAVGTVLTPTPRASRRRSRILRSTTALGGVGLVGLLALWIHPWAPHQTPVTQNASKVVFLGLHEPQSLTGDAHTVCALGTTGVYKILCQQDGSETPTSLPIPKLLKPLNSIAMSSTGVVYGCGTDVVFTTAVGAKAATMLNLRGLDYTSAFPYAAEYCYISIGTDGSIYVALTSTGEKPGGPTGTTIEESSEVLRYAPRSTSPVTLPFTFGALTAVDGIAVDPNGDVYISVSDPNDSSSGDVYRLARGASSQAEIGFDQPVGSATGIGVDSKDGVYIINGMMPEGGSVWYRSASNPQRTRLDFPTLNTPSAVFLAPDGTVFVSDSRLVDAIYRLPPVE